MKLNNGKWSINERKWNKIVRLTNNLYDTVHDNKSNRK